MKAITLYSKGEVHLRQLLEKLKNYGKLNCDFETFSNLYSEWHLKTFPGCPVNTISAIFREDWFMDFIKFLASKDICTEPEELDSTN